MAVLGRDSSWCRYFVENKKSDFIDTITQTALPLNEATVVYGMLAFHRLQRKS
jgi:hypothetical protein